MEITCPAWPDSLRIRRVDEMFSESRNSVVMSSMDGKTENCSEFFTYMVISKIRIDKVMFKMNIMSKRNVGRGMMIKAIIMITKTVITLFRTFNIC